MVNFSQLVGSRFVKALTPLAITWVVLVATLAIYDYHLASQKLADELKVLAKITLQRSHSALQQNHREQLQRELQPLLNKTELKHACFYRTDGQLLAATGEERGCLSRQLNSLHSVTVQEPLSSGGNDLGYIVLSAEIAPFKWHWLLLLALASMGVGGSIWWLNHRYHAQLSFSPISLNDKKYQQSNEEAASHVHSVGDEELEHLISVFNQLPDMTRDKKEQMQSLVIKLKDKFLQLEFKAASFEEKDKAIRQMFAGASHDLRQPLQALSLFVESLKQSASDEQLALVENLDLAIASLNTMFTDLLDLSKLESRIENVRFAPVNLRPLLERLCNEFSVVAQNKGLQLRLHTGDLMVESNDTMLERMVRNLLSNAIRYTEQGGVLLCCRVKNKMVSIEVWDTGPGIPDEKRATIFEQFVQLDEGTSESQQGLGLGLSIIKRLNDLMGHELSVDSRLGRGTVFRIAAPLYQQRKRRVTSPSLPEELRIDSRLINPALSEPPVEFSKDLSVILIDDELAVRKALGELLESWGVRVISFASVEAIWDHYMTNTAEAVDLIISDFQLSRTETAFDAIAILRVNLVEQVPVLIITGTDDKVVLNEIKESAYPILKKPVQPAKLRAMMQYIIHAHSE